MAMLLLAGLLSAALYAQTAAVVPTQMGEDLRAEARHVVIVPGAKPAEKEVSGSYEKAAAGLYGGMVQGSGMSTISKDVGPVMVNIPIPILQLPGMIFGGIAGSAQKELQEFRDALADDLLNAPSKPLSNEKIALDVYSDIRKLPGMEPRLFAPSTPLPDDTQAIVYVELTEIAIEVDGSDAIITTKANATVTRSSDEKEIYQREVRYQDRDSLSNWTADDNAAWRDYTNFARHYIARELAADIFHTIALRHVLQPAKSDTVTALNKDLWQGSSKVRSPTLSWTFELPGGEAQPPWASGIDAQQVSFELEIYDQHKPVFTQSGVRGDVFAVPVRLEDCANYYWTVRPVYSLNGEIRYGDWMRSNAVAGNGNQGKHAATLPAYLDGFASLQIKCGAR